MARTLFLVEDELLFGQRLRAAARRLGVPLQTINPMQARQRELRERLKARGVILAAHSGMDRVLARALGVSDARDAAKRPHPSS